MPLALPIAMGVSAVAGVAGAAMSASAQNKAGQLQYQASQNANATQAAQYQQTRNDLMPYSQGGQGAGNALQWALGTGGSAPSGGAGGDWQSYLQQNPDVMAGWNKAPASVKSQFGSAQNYAQWHYQHYGQGEGRGNAPGASAGMQSGYLTQPFNMTQANLEQTPGYQFNLAQGLKSVNNAMGARGLLNSGAVMKGASEYATGLADNTYQSQFNMDQMNKQNVYNKLMGMSQLGENAAAQTGSFGTQTAHDIGQNMIGGAGALGGGMVGGANSWGRGIQGIGNSLVGAAGMGAFGGPNYMAMNNGYGGNGGIYGQYGTVNGLPSSTHTAPYLGQGMGA